MCPGCPPPLQTTSIYKQADFQHSVNKNQTYSSYFSELSEILQSPKTYNSCAGESPGPIHAHTHFVALHNKIGKHTHQATTNQKSADPPKTVFFYSISGYGKFWPSKGWRIFFKKKRLGSPMRFVFAFLIKMQTFANVCGSPQPPSGPIMVPGGSTNKAKTLYPLPST